MRRLFNAIRSMTSGLLLGALLCAPSWAQGGRPDQVFIEGTTRQETGIVIENGLADVLIDRDGKEKRLSGGKVERIIWGNVSTAFREGQEYFGRGDFENAAAKFALAASDDERDVVKAVARMRSGESFLMLGALDASRFDAALGQFSQYLSQYPNSRDVPQVRAMQARATLLRGNEGDTQQAGVLYRQLFEAGSGATPSVGYDRRDCAFAGLSAVRALTNAGETLAAREIAGVLTSEINTLLPTAEEGSADAVTLAALAAEAQLLEGFVLLAAQQARQAETFFKSQLAGSKGKAAALRFGSLLGLGMAQSDQEKHREASINFAMVASIDFTDRDRAASALLLLAETMIKLGDKGATADARLRLNVLTESYGDTPSAAAARKMLATL